MLFLSRLEECSILELKEPNLRVRGGVDAHTLVTKFTTSTVSSIVPNVDSTVTGPC